MRRYCLKLTLKIKLIPNDEQHNQLLATMKQFNLACNHISRLAFDSKTFSKVALQHICYYDIREQFNLSAQMVVRAIGKVCESYKTGKQICHVFKETGAMVYDERILSFKGLEYASILTLKGRITVPMVFSKYHRDTVMGTRVRRQADLILQNNIFYIMLVIELPDKSLIDVDNYLGIDVGIVNIAVDSTGEIFSGTTVNNMRKQHNRVRKNLQSKGTKSAKRLLKKRRRKEHNFVTDTNHCISKKIVEKAQTLQMGIAMEDLTHIRKNTEKTVPKAQRNQHSSWAFYQLRSFVTYKAERAGIPFVLVNPKDTSRECPGCHYISKANRPDRDHFICQACGYAANADYIASVNISRRAVVIQPNVGA